MKNRGHRELFIYKVECYFFDNDVYCRNGIPLKKIKLLHECI